jgi:hypothetical protein
LEKYRSELEGGELLYFMEDLPGKPTGYFAPSWFYPNAALNLTYVLIPIPLEIPHKTNGS